MKTQILFVLNRSAPPMHFTWFWCQI